MSNSDSLAKKALTSAVSRFVAHTQRRAQAMAGTPLLWLALASTGAFAQDPYNDLIDTYCLKCHNSEDWAGSLAMDTLDLDHAGNDPQVWEKAIGKLRGRLMPPAGQDQPGQGQLAGHGHTFLRRLVTRQ